MAGNRDLRLYLRAINGLGILCAHYEDSDGRLQSTPRNERHALFHTLLILAGAGFSFAYAHMRPQDLYMEIYTDTGNYYESINIRSLSLGLCLLHMCLYLRRNRHKDLIQQLLQLHGLCPDQRLDRYFRRNFIIYVGLASLCLFNTLNGYTRARLSVIPTFIFIAIYFYSFLVMCLLFVFFVCLQHIVAAGLATFNRQLLGVCSASNFRHFLYRRHRLLDILMVELIACFGLLLLPIVPLILILAPSGPLFLISTVMEGKLDQISDSIIYSVTASLWVVPWLAMLTFLLRSDVITAEANKTAKILAKIPRTGTGLDKMIEKFLLKNLRQQPILTAYGFFTLDKSTLFKLFTAIFTYMVILVQFKEMENSTKSLQKEN